MSNYFNSKSQVSKNKKEINSKPNAEQNNYEKPRYENSNIFSKKVSDKAFNKALEREKEKEENRLSKALSIENFPELVSVGKKVDTIQGNSFLEKTKPKQIEIVESLTQEEIPYGWVEITRDSATNRLVLKYNADYEADEKRKREEEESKKKEEKSYSYEVINALSKLHLKRTQEYIDNWGYSEYEQMFLCPHYDYEYFDKLDELYEEMENESSAESDSDEY